MLSAVEAFLGSFSGIGLDDRHYTTTIGYQKVRNPTVV
jgi:hypothetical protein